MNTRRRMKTTKNRRNSRRGEKPLNANAGGRATGSTPPMVTPYSSAQAATRALLAPRSRSEEHTSELQSRLHLVCRLLLEKKKCSRRSQADTVGTARAQRYF